MVRIQPDPPDCHIPEEDTWGISSAGRAPALQAGGRRFDPVILHHLCAIARVGDKVVEEAARSWKKWFHIR